jgi:hypothetical protein
LNKKKIITTKKTNKMTIHLLKTPEYPIEQFNEVAHLLQSFQGIMHFETYNKNFDTYISKNTFPFLNVSATSDVLQQEMRPLFWEELFYVCKAYRKFYEIDDNDFVILLTLRRNINNWFSSMEENFERNIFVQASDWELFVPYPSKYPVAYEVVGFILRNLMKVDYERLYEYAHFKARGCMNDFCGTKTDITLKLRTGDICPDCIKKLTKQGVSISLIQQAAGVFEYIRQQLLYKQHFSQLLKPSRLVITKGYKIFLLDYENVEICLSPTQKSIYFLFLKHTEGIKFSTINDYKEKLQRIYEQLSPRMQPDKIEATIRKICADDVTPLASLKTYISQIKREFKIKLGANATSMLDLYCILGEDGEAKKIALDRSLVTVPQNIHRRNVTTNDIENFI